MSVEGCARKNPLIPPLMNTETKPKQNSEAVLNLNLAPYTEPTHIRTATVEGIVIISVGTENRSAENGFSPLTNI